MIGVRLVQYNNDSQVNMQEWILPELSDEVECLVHDFQAEDGIRDLAR